MGVPDLGRVLAVGRRWWWLLIAVACLGGWVTNQLDQRAGTLYVAQAGVLVGPVGADFNTLRAAGQQAHTLANLAGSRPVLEAAQRRAGAASEGDLSLRVTAAADDATRMLTIWTTAANPRHAAIVANAVASELTIAAGPLARNVTVVDPAQPPTQPLIAGTKPLTAIGAVAGLLLALMVLLVHDYFRGRVAGPSDLPRLTGAAHLATLHRPRRGRSPLAIDNRSESDLRLLAGQIALAAPGHGCPSVVVTTAQTGEPSGDVAGKLAAAIAAAGSRVVLVDADPEAAQVTRLLGLEAEPGLGKLLECHGEGPDIFDLAVAERTRLRVLPVGRHDGHRSLGAPVAARILERILEHADVVVVSAGSASTSADALTWASCARGTVLAVRRGRTRHEAVIRAGSAIGDVGGRLVGTVLAAPPRAIGNRSYLSRLRRARPQRPLRVAPR